MTQDELKALVTYCPETGRFFRDGEEFGYYYQGGKCTPYVRLVFKKRKYLAHRMAWLYMTGEMPPNCIDHINGDPTDNRWCNLRLATVSENMRNRRVSSNNKVGLKGVSRHVTGGFRATITISDRQFSLGYFKCPAAAHFAYIIAAEERFGEFANAG